VIRSGKGPAWRSSPDQCSCGSALSSLTSKQRQALAVERSSVVGLADLYGNREQAQIRPARDTMLTGVLEGILFRMNPLVQGAAAVQFSPGKDVCRLRISASPMASPSLKVDVPGRVRQSLPAGLVGWHTYLDRVARASTMCT